MIIPTAESSNIPGIRAACLRVHIATGAPKEMRWMGDHLNRAGYSLPGMLLIHPGNNTVMPLINAEIIQLAAHHWQA
jgi:esterase/lipase